MGKINLADDIKNELRKHSDKKKAEFFPRYFKTGKGEYGYGDKFLGVTLPHMHTVANKFKKSADLDAIKSLLRSSYHEERTLALMMLVDKYKHSDEKMKSQIFNFYLKNTKFINNWDLVDISADKIVGEYLFNKDRKILYKLAGNSDLWNRRIAIISTFYFIKRNQFTDTLKISKILLKSREDLIHKAVGWMLREVGKRDMNLLQNFLKDNYTNIPRTTLRYAIEKFYPDERIRYLKGDFGASKK